LQGLVKAFQPSSNEVQLGIKQMKIRLLTGLLTLLMPAMVMAGEYGLTVDRVKIDTGDFVKEGIGYNGASPGPVMRFKDRGKQKRTKREGKRKRHRTNRRPVRKKQTEGEQTENTQQLKQKEGRKPNEDNKKN